ncbi:MAG TPA: hypothetical protein VMG40_20355 [Bryobacteraceae bacterium]|nr:hypothetical protein [Bryobacteraceae bacterium]
MESIGNTARCVLVFALVSVFGMAQETPRACYKAGGDGPLFTITLDGKDVSKIQNVNVSSRARNQVPPKRNDLVNNFGSPGVSQSSPGVFNARIKIPANAISGMYSITTINASGDGFSISYDAGSDFSAPPDFEVCENNFEAPKIKSVIEHR